MAGLFQKRAIITPERIIKIAVWIAPVCLVVWLLIKNFAPFGSYSVTFHPNQKSLQVSNFAAKETDRIIGSSQDGTSPEYYQLITTSPVYFDVKSPRLFPKATVSVVYKNPDIQPVLRLGIKQASGGYAYKDLAYHEELIENLPNYWHEIREGDFVLFQKDVQHFDSVKKIETERAKTLKNIRSNFSENIEYESSRLGRMYHEQVAKANEQFDANIKNLNIEPFQPTYDSLNEFLLTPPDIASVAHYKYDASSIWQLPNYSPQPDEVTYNKSLRGNHTIFTYIGPDETLHFSFMVQDLNFHEGRDDLTIDVVDSFGKIVSQVLSEDDGDTSRSGKTRAERAIDITLPHLPFGTYQLSITIPKDDIMIKKMTTSQKLFSFDRKMYLTDNQVYRNALGDTIVAPSIIYTNSSEVKIRTSHSEGIQDVQVGNETISVDTIGELETVSNLKGITKIKIPRNDIYIEGDGFFSYTIDNFFDPTAEFADSVEDVDAVDAFNYIIARYPKKVTDDGWYSASAQFSIPELYMNKSANPDVNFIISLPGLPEEKRVLKIREITITFEKDPLTPRRVVEKIKSFFD